MARPWSRKRNEAKEPAPPNGEPVESVRLDDDDHAWWVQEDVKEVWRPKARLTGATEAEPDRDILAEHFGEDWRTSFGFTPPTDEELTAEAEREQQALDDQDPYKVLDVDPDASWDDIIAAHRHQARVNHPDLLFGQSEEEKAVSEERIRVINAAYKDLRIRRGR
ncbi:MAG: J domain-containing protein [Acidimicrobiales bacterium]